MRYHERVGGHFTIVSEPFENVAVRYLFGDLVSPVANLSHAGEGCAMLRGFVVLMLLFFAARAAVVVWGWFTQLKNAASRGEGSHGRRRSWFSACRRRGERTTWKQDSRSAAKPNGSAKSSSRAPVETGQLCEPTQKRAEEEQHARTRGD